MTINILIPRLSEAGKIEQITQEINSIKSDETIFFTLLKEQPYSEVNKSTSNIIFGNPHGKILVTILTNPHCSPCAQMHARIEELIKQNSEICIQYLFSSFREDLDSSNKFLIAVYQNNDIDETRKIYSDWFEKGKLETESYFKKYRLNIENEKVETELKKHELWKLNSRIISTPYILVNGYKLPDNYKIEDLIHY